MTVNDFIISIVAVLKTIAPTKFVYVDEIPNNADGNYFVHCTDQSHAKRLDRRRQRDYSFEVLYFSKKKDSMSFNDFSEDMYWRFETLEVSGQIIHLTNAKAVYNDDLVYHFTFDVSFSALIVSIGDPMQNLEVTGGIKP